MLDQSDLTIPSPIQEVKLELLDRQNVKLLVKREDLIHPTISGNKWRKLKGSLLSVKQDGYKGIITYGGAFSNHIHATAAAGQQFDIPTVGIIRGEYDEQNPTLQFAKQSGMKLHFVTRSSYRQKEHSAEVQEILKVFDNYLVVPEGGSSKLAMHGLTDLAGEIITLPNLDLITVSAGTGMTAAGIIKYQPRPVDVFSALKSDHLKNEIVELSGKTSFSFNTDYHFGGYGKVDHELIDFINSFFTTTGIPLDPIYNGKAMYGIIDQIKTGKISSGTTVLHIHTGGLQGVGAYNYMATKKDRNTIKEQS